MRRLLAFLLCLAVVAAFDPQHPAPRGAPVEACVVTLLDGFVQGDPHAYAAFVARVCGVAEAATLNRPDRDGVEGDDDEEDEDGTLAPRTGGFA